MTRWFVKWPSSPTGYGIAFGPHGMKPAEIMQTLEQANVKTGLERHWTCAYVNKPRWTADERQFRGVRGWRRAHSMHVANGVRVFGMAGTVQRKDKL